jgi:hypothetical protein
MPIVGLAVFSLIKYAGYFLFFKYSFKSHKRDNNHIPAITRVVLGIAVGMAIHFSFSTGRDIFPVYFSAILIGRVIVWFVILNMFYKEMTINKKIAYTVFGTVISYLLDIPSVIGLFVVVGPIC